mmetsp:Transcript_19763/g.32022  ORF Transcript_19763/g.32022 Transcript_19763/m.32022 type:complete len:112 (+) Transcript_19763:48-383(+)
MLATNVVSLGRPVNLGRRVGPTHARSVRVHSVEKKKNSGEIHTELKEKFTTSGGGYKGFCDYEEIKDAIKECDGLDGGRLEACYAQFGCDVDKVTDHYAKAAGISSKKEKK